MDKVRLNMYWVKKPPLRDFCFFLRNLDGGEGLPLHHHCVALVLLRGHQASKPDRREAQDDDVDIRIRIMIITMITMIITMITMIITIMITMIIMRMTNQLLFVSSGELSGVGW